MPVEPGIRLILYPDYGGNVILNRNEFLFLYGVRSCNGYRWAWVSTADRWGPMGWVRYNQLQCVYCAGYARPQAPATSMPQQPQGVTPRTGDALMRCYSTAFARSPHQQQIALARPTASEQHRLSRGSSGPAGGNDPHHAVRTTPIVASGHIALQVDIDFFQRADMRSLAARSLRLG